MRPAWRATRPPDSGGRRGRDVVVQSPQGREEAEADGLSGNANELVSDGVDAPSQRHRHVPSSSYGGRPQRRPTATDANRRSKRPSRQPHQGTGMVILTAQAPALKRITTREQKVTGLIQGGSMA